MVQNSETRRRGRPPAYDPERALARALDRFWTTGFAATSLDDLSAATGMNRPSLYGAFGDKRALFLKAIQAYRDRGGGVMAAVMRPDRPLRETLSAAYAAALDLYFSGEAGARGCFLTGAATVGAVGDPEVGAAVLSALVELDAAFARLFRHARTRGEIGPEADPAALGRLASGMLHTLSIRARAGATRTDLERMAEEAVTLLAAAPRPPP